MGRAATLASIVCCVDAALILLLCNVSLSSQQPRPHPHGSGASGAVVRVLPHRAALPRHGCHHDRERQLRTHRRQDLRLRPGPDGKHSVLPARRLQDHVPAVSVWIFSWSKSNKAMAIVTSQTRTLDVLISAANATGASESQKWKAPDCGLF